MKQAHCAIPKAISYRAESFAAGLARCGFKISDQPRAEPGNVLVIWNRMPRHEHIAANYERAGCPVIVAENGWIGADPDGDKLYALQLGHHNGAGTWPVGGPERWSSLGIEVKPWRESGDHILVLPQRGIGEPGVAMPKTWTETTVQRLRRATDRPIKVRRHPGGPPLLRPPLDPDLAGCHAVVTWASGGGIKAIVAGVPVFHEMNRWLGASAAVHGLKALEQPFLGDRLPMLERLAWAQWSAKEISTGEPFARLLDV